MGRIPAGSGESRPLFHQLSEHLRQLVDHLTVPLAQAVGHAGAQVFAEQFPAEAVQGGIDGRNLDENIRAVHVLLQHFPQAPHLAFDAAEPVVQLFKLVLAARSGFLTIAGIFH